MTADLLWRSLLVRRRSGVREELSSNPSHPLAKSTGITSGCVNKLFPVQSNVKRFGLLLTTGSREPVRETEGGGERRANPAVQHDSHMRRSGSDLAGDRTRSRDGPLRDHRAANQQLGIRNVDSSSRFLFAHVLNAFCSPSSRLGRQHAPVRTVLENQREQAWLSRRYRNSRCTSRSPPTPPFLGAKVAERLARLPPTKVNRAQSRPDESGFVHGNLSPTLASEIPYEDSFEERRRPTESSQCITVLFKQCCGKTNQCVNGRAVALELRPLAKLRGLDARIVMSAQITKLLAVLVTEALVRLAPISMPIGKSENASDIDIGRILSQEMDEKEVALQFSKTISNLERNYFIEKSEQLTVAKNLLNINALFHRPRTENIKLLGARGGVMVRILACHLGEPGSILGGVAPGFSHLGIVPYDAAGRWVYLGDLPFPGPFLSGDVPYTPRFTLVGSQDFDAESRPNLSTEHGIVILSSRGPKRFYTRAGETGDPRENPQTNGIAHHDFHLRKSGDAAGDLTQLALVGGERANRSATVPPPPRAIHQSKFKKGLERRRFAAILLPRDRRDASEEDHRALVPASTPSTATVEEVSLDDADATAKGLVNPIIQNIRLITSEVDARNPTSVMHLIALWCKSWVEVARPLVLQGHLVETQEGNQYRRWKALPVHFVQNARDPQYRPKNRTLGRSGAGMQGRGKQEYPESTRRQAASSGTIATRENPGVNPPGIEPGSPRRGGGRGP
ncbi:hypothetical protein PR048_003459 [Dryococelus australis]|uniref:Uncharacterized protein n=1 Tax=Dryococelus australis TaxID=614101 RepID=A0ABQ9IN61_9NEOP|nr:hypothetical protein PR048_003459 [Dryococelus australis]